MNQSRGLDIDRRGVQDYQKLTVEIQRGENMGFDTFLLVKLSDS